MINFGLSTTNLRIVQVAMTDLLRNAMHSAGLTCGICFLQLRYKFQMEVRKLAGVARTATQPGSVISNLQEMQILSQGPRTAVLLASGRRSLRHTTAA